MSSTPRLFMRCDRINVTTPSRTSVDLLVNFDESENLGESILSMSISLAGTHRLEDILTSIIENIEIALRTSATLPQVKEDLFLVIGEVERCISQNAMPIFSWIMRADRPPLSIYRTNEGSVVADWSMEA